MAEYIDIEKAIEYLNRHKECAKRNNMMLCADEDAIISFLKTKCKLEDVEPVIHGHWEKMPEYYDGIKLNDQYYSCSKCGRYIHLPFGTQLIVEEEYPYCHCGAKMDEEAVK